jgi:hypothetical protein
MDERTMGNYDLVAQRGTEDMLFKIFIGLTKKSDICSFEGRDEVALLSILTRENKIRGSRGKEPSSGRQRREQ